MVQSPAMALQLLILPLPPRPRLSLASLKHPPPLSIHPSSTHLKKWGATATIRFNLRPSLITPLRCSTTTAEAEAVVVEEKEAEETPAEPRRRLIAQNVPWTCTCEDIRSLFEKHGTVLGVELSMYNKSRNRGLAFITMASEEDARVALKNLDSHDMDGRIIRVDFARPLKKSPPAAAVPAEKYGVFVGNLAWRVRTRNLRELFETTGNVVSADVIFQTEPRRPAGYGFVYFSSKEAADAAVATFNGKVLMGRPIRVIPKESQTSDDKGKSTEGEQPDDALSEAAAGDDRYDVVSSEVTVGDEGEQPDDALSEAAAGDDRYDVVSSEVTAGDDKYDVVSSEVTAGDDKYDVVSSEVTAGDDRYDVVSSEVTAGDE